MNYNQEEIDKFNSQADNWWDLDGPFKTLHQINPLRLRFIMQNTNLLDQDVLDIGCGGGILTESLYCEGAITTGIDLAPLSIEVAKKHARVQNYNIDYHCIGVSDQIKLYDHGFDVITCMEMLEHVDDKEAIIKEIARIIKPDGVVFLSTLNRTSASYLLGVIAAEYLLHLLPKGTHDYKKFIRPSELSLLLYKYGLEIVDIAGIKYNVISKSFYVSKSVDINYMVACRRI